MAGLGIAKRGFGLARVGGAKGGEEPTQSLTPLKEIPTPKDTYVAKQPVSVKKRPEETDNANTALKEIKPIKNKTKAPDESVKHEKSESKKEESKETSLEKKGYVETKKGKMVKEKMAKGGKVGKVMHEFKTGKLHSGKKGPVVKSRKQAIAIALSEAGKSKMANGGKPGLWANINARKKAGTSRSKSNSTISPKAYANMKAGFPKKKK
jgi:hypothetical protein